MAKSLSLLDRAVLPMTGPSGKHCSTCGNTGVVECQRCGEHCVCEALGEELCPDCGGGSSEDITDALLYSEDVRRETRTERRIAANAIERGKAAT